MAAFLLGRRLGSATAAITDSTRSALAPLPLRWRPLLRYAFLATVAFVLAAWILLLRPVDEFNNNNNNSNHINNNNNNNNNNDNNGKNGNKGLGIGLGSILSSWEGLASHPIDSLIQEAHERHERLLQTEQSHGIAEAAARYRERRHRHPPPGFDAWVEYALRHDAVLVESFFDRIYHDLTPFWGLEPRWIAERASAWHHVVRVRRGVVTGTGNVDGLVPWLRLWTDLVSEAAPYLPDVDMPINYMDEPRLLVPWETIAELVTKEQASRKGGKGIVPTSQVVAEYSGLGDVDAANDPFDPNSFGTVDPFWTHEEQQPWELVRGACPPGSPARSAPALERFDRPPTIPAGWKPGYLYRGYVQNATAARDPCTQPHLRGMHGSFIEPVSVSTSRDLVPLFGGSKLPANNEILIPGAMYLTDDPFYSGGESRGPPWEEKRDGVIWRGVASGGRHRKENWMGFQRHRLVQMLNGTTVSALESRLAGGKSLWGGGSSGGRTWWKTWFGDWSWSGNTNNSSSPESSLDFSNREPTFVMPTGKTHGFPRDRTGQIGQWLSTNNFADAGFVELLCFPREGGNDNSNNDDDANSNSNSNECSYLAPYFRPVDPVPMADQYAVKLAPDVDGNSFSARYRGFLLSSSLPIKATVYAEWHDDRLQPWLHYAPMDNSLRDLYGLLDYFSRDDDDGRGDAAARHIAESGRDWAARVLRRTDMLLYVWRVLLEFARVCDERRDVLGFADDLLRGVSEGGEGGEGAEAVVEDQL